MMTYEDAMAEATDMRDLAYAAHCLNVAREIREAGTSTIACPVPHFAVQDVEAEHCEHHVIAVRLPGATERWWHVESKQWCVPLDQTVILEPVRRSTVDNVQRRERELRSTEQTCVTCEHVIYWHEARGTWIHRITDSWVCPIESPIGQPHPGAWPKAAA